MENATVAALLRRIADLLDYQGVQFKPAAYRRAAQTIEDLPKDVAEMQDRKELLKLPGIGEAIADKILEYCRTGRIRHLDELEAETQMGAASLLAVEGLGPKRVRQIEQSLNIRSIPELTEAAKQERLQKLPGFSEVLEKKILENAGRALERSKRFPIGEIEADVQSLLALLRAMRSVTKAEVAGSFRRRKETVGDVDILLAVPKHDAALANAIETSIQKLPIVDRIIASGDTKISFDLTSGLRIDVRIVADEEWGSALLYFTGSKEHNITLRRLAIEKGFKLSEYGLFNGKKRIASRTEEEVYQALGLRWIEPKERRAEIEN
jgi:DNA polymerase (family 10)